MDLTSLLVKPATDAQWYRSQQNQYEHWSDGLSFEQFVERDRLLLLEHPYAKENWERWYTLCKVPLAQAESQILFRVLVPKNDADTMDILSACETFRRQACINSRAAGRPEIKTCYSVCTVFTAKSNRSKGYATRMLSLLHDYFAGDGICSVLYSYVGDFYARALRFGTVGMPSSGWQIRSPFRLEWEAASLEKAADTATTPILEKDLDDICQRDRELLVLEVAASPSSAMTLLPSADQIKWIQLHETICDKLLAPGEKASPEVLGCQISERHAPDWAFAIWTRKSSEGELSIIRMRCSSTAQLRALVEAARVIAVQHGLTKITAWNMEERLLEGTGWQNARMKESLPALAWYGEEPAPVKWLANERWAWC